MNPLSESLQLHIAEKANGCLLVNLVIDEQGRKELDYSEL